MFQRFEENTDFLDVDALHSRYRWTNSYFVATTGGTTLEVIKKYVENQRNA